MWIKLPKKNKKQKPLLLVFTVLVRASGATNTQRRQGFSVYAAVASLFSISMGSTVVKTEEELRKEIDELQRQQRDVCFSFCFAIPIYFSLFIFCLPYLWLCFHGNLQITERLRDPRGLRRGRLSVPGPRNFAANGARQRGYPRYVIFSLLHFYFVLFCFYLCIVFSHASKFPAKQTEFIYFILFFSSLGR